MSDESRKRRNDAAVSKAAEFRVAVWFMEAGWEVFIPAYQNRQTDFVVRIPEDDELVAIEVKSTQIESLNAGQLANEWGKARAPFHYLIFIEGRRERGVILPREYFTNRGRTRFIFDLIDGYSQGEVRKTLRPFAFDLRNRDDWTRASQFCTTFLALHRHPPPLPPTDAEIKEARGRKERVRRANGRLFLLQSDGLERVRRLGHTLRSGPEMSGT